MTFDRNLLPDPPPYFEEQGHKLTGPARAKWKTTNCRFHGGSDSIRVNTVTGAWVCMSCGAKGGDVLSFHMQAHGLEFVDAAKALGAWVDDGRQPVNLKPTALSPRNALEVLGFESTLVAVAAGNLAAGRPISESDRARLLVCCNRIKRLVEDFA
jgi:hypothetical protein